MGNLYIVTSVKLVPILLPIALIKGSVYHVRVWGILLAIVPPFVSSVRVVMHRTLVPTVVVGKM